MLGESGISDMRSVKFDVTFDPGDVKHLFRDCQSVELQIGDAKFAATIESVNRINDEEASVTFADVREVK